MAEESEDPEAADSLNKVRTWWQVDSDGITGSSSSNSSSHQGATALVKRCMRTYGWSFEKAKKILEAYRQFLALKKEHEDWDAKVLSPSHLVDQIWHQHILDVGNYYNDMILLCGRVVLHNPDGALDQEAKKARDAKTRTELIRKFGEENVDCVVWGFPPVDDGKFVMSIAFQETEKQLYYKISGGVRMIKVFNNYASRWGLNKTHIRFLYGGIRIREFQTARELGLKEGDKIEAVQSERAVTGPMVIKFADQLNFRMRRRIHSAYRMRKSFNKYARIAGLRRDQLLFLHRDVLVRDDDTPEHHDMHDGSQIDVEVVRGGC